MHVTTGREALESLDGIDIVLLDHQLPDANGLDILEVIRARPNPPAVVLITAHGNESLAAGALRLGADDYLAKDQSLLEMLPEILERVRRSRELRKALVAAERDLVRAERLAAIGEMTVALHHGINNPLMSASTDVELLLADPDLPRSSGSRPWKVCARRCAASATSSGRSATCGHPYQDLPARDPDGGSRCREHGPAAPPPGHRAGAGG